MKKLLPIAALASLLSACAGISQQAFYANPADASPFEMCKTLSTGVPDMNFANALRMELGRRGVAESSCPQIIKTRETGVGVGVAAGVVALAIAASKSSNTSVGVGVGGTIGLGGGSTSGPAAVPVAEQFAWDQYLGENGSAIWTCRSIQTGVPADPAYCNGKPMADTTWPGMAAPLR
jgi:hypothetical protein